MTGEKRTSSTQRALLVTALAGTALILCTWLFGAQLVRVFEIREGDRTIRASGSARVRVRSDLVMWRATINARGATLREGWSTLSTAMPRVRQFLIDQGIPENEIIISSVTTREINGRNPEGYRDPNVIVGYRLSQVVEVTSGDIERVTEASRRITELIEGGIEISSSRPEYVYTGLQELRMRLVADAAQVAREQAQRIAEANGSRITGIASARTGVVQLNAANETRVAWDGVRDTTSIEKDAFVVVAMRYHVE